MHWPLVRRHRARGPLVHIAWSSAPPSTVALHHDMQPRGVQAGVDLALPYRTVFSRLRPSGQYQAGSMRFVTGALADMA